MLPEVNQAAGELGCVDDSDGWLTWTPGIERCRNADPKEDLGGHSDCQVKANAIEGDVVQGLPRNEVGGGGMEMSLCW